MGCFSSPCITCGRNRAPFPSLPHNHKLHMSIDSTIHVYDASRTTLMTHTHRRYSGLANICSSCAPLAPLALSHTCVRSMHASPSGHTNAALLHQHVRELLPHMERTHTLHVECTHHPTRTATSEKTEEPHLLSAICTGAIPSVFSAVTSAPASIRSSTAVQAADVGDNPAARCSAELPRASRSLCVRACMSVCVLTHSCVNA